MVPFIAGRPDIMEGRTSLTVYPGMIGMPDNAFIDVKNKSSAITAELEIPATGASGSSWHRAACTAAGVCTSRTTGPSLPITSWVRLRLSLPASPCRRALSPIAYDFAYDGGGLGKGGTGTLSVNGKKVATGSIERTTPLIFGVETSDVGMNMYTTVTDDYAKGDNAFTGTIRQVRIDVTDPAGPGRAHPDPELVHHQRG